MLLGKGDGTFEPPIFISFRNILKVANFNGDGNLDLMYYTGWREPFIRILLGNGDGTFSQSVITEARSVSSIEIGDFNSDGLDDFVVPHLNTSVFINQGDGTFVRVWELPAFGATDVGLIDFDRNGVLDLVFVTLSASSGSSGTTGTTGAFGSSSSYGSSCSTGTTGFEKKGNIVIYIGNGDGTFRWGTSYSLPVTRGFSRSLTVGDLNGLGYDDIVVKNRANIAVVLNDVRNGPTTSVNLNSNVLLEVSITNSIPVPLTDVNFVDILPPQLSGIIESQALYGPGCKGVISHNSTELSLSSGVIPAYSTCVYRALVKGTSLGSTTNTVTVNSNNGNTATSNTAVLEVISSK